MVVHVPFSEFYASSAKVFDKNVALCDVKIAWLLALPDVEYEAKLVRFYPGCGNAFNLIVLGFLFLVWRAIMRFSSRYRLADLLASAVKKGGYC